MHFRQTRFCTEKKRKKQEKELPCKLHYEHATLDHFRQYNIVEERSLGVVAVDKDLERE